MKKIKWQEHILSDPQILFGKPCVKDTRIPVDLILETGQMRQKIVRKILDHLWCNQL